MELEVLRCWLYAGSWHWARGKVCRELAGNKAFVWQAQAFVGLGLSSQDGLAVLLPMGQPKVGHSFLEDTWRPHFCNWAVTPVGLRGRNIRLVWAKSRHCGITETSPFWLGVVGLEPTGFKGLKPLALGATGLLSLSFGTIGDIEWEGCQCDFSEESAGISGPVMGD